MDTELKQHFEKVDQRFDRMEKFLFEKVALKEDLVDLAARMDKLEQTVSRLVDTVDKLTISVNKVVEDHTVLKHQMTAVQDWIREASKKIGIEFKL